MIKFMVTWDNGAGACGIFPYEFDTFEAAHTFGRDWAYECNVRDFSDPDPLSGYEYDVLEFSSLKDGEAE